MVSLTRIRAGASGLVGLLAVAAVMAGCGSTSSTSSSAAAASSKAASSGVVAVGTTSGAVGIHLTGASGRPLYMWAADTGGKSNCAGQCAKFWPPLVATTTTPKVTGAANAADVGVITRADGTKQVTYKGHPLYYFLEDRTAGSFHGQGNNGFGAKWWLVAPTGALITKAATSSSAPVSSSSSSSGGSHYGY
jgi:predicted lipoprotein with Yx(FWY)xxD motif